jgi:hypothetical protein
MSSIVAHHYCLAFNINNQLSKVASLAPPNLNLSKLNTKISTWIYEDETKTYLAGATIILKGQTIDVTDT